MADEQDLEDVSKFKLSDEEIAWLYEKQSECTVCWTNKDGWPVGMMHNYVVAEGSFWVTMSGQRKRVLALRQRPKACLVMSSKATKRGGGDMVAIKALATIHEDRERLRWYLPLFFDRAGLPQSSFDDFFTPRRIVVEFKPVEVLSFSSTALRAVVAAAAPVTKG